MTADLCYCNNAKTTQIISETQKSVVAFKTIIMLILQIQKLQKLNILSNIIQLVKLQNTKSELLYWRCTFS